jgi:DNA-binding CsgD family transcriptional regulator
MTTPEGPVLITSADRLFLESAARYVERATGASTLVEQDGLGALMTIARHQPWAVLVLGDPERLPATAFARRVVTRWPTLPVVVLGSGAGSGGALPATADGAAILNALATSPSQSPRARDDARAGEVVQLQSLTKRERAVLVLLGRGLEFKDIADRLSISEHTVRTHLQNLYRKLNVHSRLDIVRLVSRNGLLDASEG